jgi:hypothetical protein
MQEGEAWISRRGWLLTKPRLAESACLEEGRATSWMVMSTMSTISLGLPKVVSSGPLLSSPGIVPPVVGES